MINRNYYILLNTLTLSPYQCVRENGEIIVNTSLGAFTVILPNNPILGTTVLVIDATGNASTNNVTIQSNSQLINGNPTYTLDVDYGAVRFIFDTLNNDQVGIQASGGGGSAIAPPVGTGTVLYSDGINQVETDEIEISPSNFVRINGTVVMPTTTLIDNTDSPYTVLNSEFRIDADTTSGNIQINLPATPMVGEVKVIKDSAGTSSGFPITIQGNGNTIDGSTAFIIAQSYESFTFYFNGTEWKLS